MELAIRTARQDLLDGFCIEEISSRVKSVASFAGSMRKNLLSILGIPEELEKSNLLSSIATELFKK
jgi:hypothetical protein